MGQQKNNNKKSDELSFGGGITSRSNWQKDGQKDFGNSLGDITNFYVDETASLQKRTGTTFILDIPADSSILPTDQEQVARAAALFPFDQPNPDENKVFIYQRPINGNATDTMALQCLSVAPSDYPRTNNTPWVSSAATIAIDAPAVTTSAKEIAQYRAYNQNYFLHQKIETFITDGENKSFEFIGQGPYKVINKTPPIINFDTPLNSAATPVVVMALPNVAPNVSSTVANAIAYNVSATNIVNVATTASRFLVVDGINGVKQMLPFMGKKLQIKVTANEPINTGQTITASQQFHEIYMTGNIVSEYKKENFFMVNTFNGIINNFFHLQ